MGTTLIINPGSSSKKFALYQAGKRLITWHFENTGQGFTVCTEENGTRSLCTDITAAVFGAALTHVLKEAKEKGFVKKSEDITHVGVRVVAPATYFTEHRRIDAAYVKKLAALEPLAPHHIPEMVAEIKEVQKVLPHAALVGVSDSAFHTTAKDTQKLAGLPRVDAERYDIHRFGYHGISVGSVVKHVEAKEGKLPQRMVVCHIGSGVSVSGVENGKSVGNSMGFTPVSGVLMSSRAGDMSADVLAALVVHKGLRKGNIFSYLYNEGGFKGLAGVKDLRLVLDRADKGDEDANQALTLLGEEVRSYIAHFAMLMGGLDVIVLTATAAERNPVVRSLLVGQLPLFDTFIHNDHNESLMNCEGYIHTEDSQVRILVLKTDELGEMYRITTEC